MRFIDIVCFRNRCLINIHFNWINCECDIHMYLLLLNRCYAIHDKEQRLNLF